MSKLGSLGLVGVLIAGAAVCEGQSRVKADLELVDQNTSLGKEVVAFLRDWRTDVVSRDPERVARHAWPDYKIGVLRHMRDKSSALYKELYVRDHSVEQVIKPVPDSHIVAFVHKMNAEGTYVLGCYERTPGALTVPPPPYVELMKRLKAKDVFCLDLVKDGGKWNVDYTFAGENDGK